MRRFQRVRRDRVENLGRGMVYVNRLTIMVLAAFGRDNTRSLFARVCNTYMYIPIHTRAYTTHTYTLCMCAWCMHENTHTPTYTMHTPTHGLCVHGVCTCMYS